MDGAQTGGRPDETAEPGDQAVKQRSEPVACAQCGKPTWSADGTCTACRQAVQRVPATQRQVAAEEGPVLVMPDLDEAGNLKDDVHCRRCGYNLRGLKPAGRCPECKLPASRSIFGDWLKLCDPGWIKRLKNGVQVLLGAIIGGVAFWIIYFVAIIFIAPMGGPMGFVTGSVVIATAALGLLWFAGVWLLTSPDPGAEQVESPRSARAVARWCSVAMVAAMPVSIYQQSGMNLAAPAPAAAPLDLLLVAVSTVLGLAGIIATAAGVIYLRSLALRIPVGSLATQTHVVGWGYVIVSTLGQLQAVIFSFIVFPVMGGAAGAAWGGGGGPVFTLLMSIFGAFGCVIALASLVFGIWMIVLLFQYVAAFDKAHGQAMEIAAQA